MKQYFDIDEELLEKVRNITDVDYQNHLVIEDLYNIIKDMVVEYHRKEEELEDLKQEIRDNYKPRHFDPYEEYGVSQRDFY